MLVNLHLNVLGTPMDQPRACPTEFSKHETIADVKTKVASMCDWQAYRVYRVLDSTGNSLSDTKVLKDCIQLHGIISLHLTVDLLPKEVQIPSWTDPLLNEARNLRPNLVMSDVTTFVDARPLQWVNLVLQGGGVLGIAHVGFVAALEEAGVRFMGLGGTSAGAINAAMIAAVRDRLDDTSWVDTFRLLQNSPMAKFEDGPGYFKSLRKSLGKGSTLMKLLGAVTWHNKQLFHAWGHLGMHPGDTFYKWLADSTSSYAVPNKAALDSKLQLTEALRQAFNFAGEIKPALAARLRPSLKLVTAELGTQTMVIFPRDADLFYQTPAAAPVADFVRASMSVPIFFEPFKLPPGDQNLPGAGNRSIAWECVNGFKGNVPAKGVFCDGGVLSNFPMSQFHDGQKMVSDGVTYILPTIGVQLGHSRNDPVDIGNPLALLRAMSNTSSHLLDSAFLHNHPEYVHLVANIDTSRFNWLNFDLTSKDREDLMKAGMEVGIAFLKTWTVDRDVAGRRPPVVLHVRQDSSELGLVRVIPMQRTPGGGFEIDVQQLPEAGWGSWESLSAEQQSVLTEITSTTIANAGVLDLSFPAHQATFLGHLVTYMRDGNTVHPYTYNLAGGKWQVFKAMLA